MRKSPVCSSPCVRLRFFDSPYLLLVNQKNPNRHKRQELYLKVGAKIMEKMGSL